MSRDVSTPAHRRPAPLCLGTVLVDPPVLQAPMAGFTNSAFRQIVREFGGAGLLATEMVSARGLLGIDARGEGLPERLWGVAEEPRPLAVQIWDNDPMSLAAVAARLVEQIRPSVIDINFGCPVKAVAVGAKSGSYLLRYPDRIASIVAGAVEAARPTPVTAKIRLGPNRCAINAIDVAQAIEGAGAAGITIHGRTAADGFSGRADWDQIAQVKSHLAQIPLIGNGDLVDAHQAAAAFDRYGVDGIMIGRAALARPWIFREVQAALKGLPIPPAPSPDQQRQLLLDHFRILICQFGPEKATILMRKYACCYARGQFGVRQFRAAVARVATPEQFAAAVETTFPREDFQSTGDMV